MLKKTIKYTDFDDNEITEDFYFNLTEAELVEMETQTGGGLKAKIERIMNTRDVSEIMKIFKDIIIKSYGVRSDDRKRFIKNQEVTDAFVQSNAYSELYIELVSNVNSAIEFITGIMPKKVSSQIDKKQLESLINNPQAAIEAVKQ